MPTSICDYCATEAYDMGFETIDDQEAAMQELGDEVPDHLCEEIEEQGAVRCGCACKGDTKTRLRAAIANKISPPQSQDIDAYHGGW